MVLDLIVNIGNYKNAHEKRFPSRASEQELSQANMLILTLLYLKKRI